MQFRRGSNNKKFVEKKNIALGPGRKKKRRSRAVIKSDSEIW